MTPRLPKLNTSPSEPRPRRFCFQGAYIFCTMLTIAGKDFPKSPQEIAVPTLVMELKDSVEALKPKPKEQAGSDGRRER